VLRFGQVARNGCSNAKQSCLLLSASVGTDMFIE
jgi:hypothetical protein